MHNHHFGEYSNKAYKFLHEFRNFSPIFEIFRFFKNFPFLEFI